MGIRSKPDFKKYGLAFLLLVCFFVGMYINEGRPGTLNNRAWAYLHPEDAGRDVSKWVYKFEIQDYRNGGGHEVFEIKNSKFVSLNGHKVCIIVFKSTNPDSLADSRVYFDYYTRQVLGIDMLA